MGFSCEELQDINLELSVDNSAFYDQFAIAQVGRKGPVCGSPDHPRDKGFLEVGRGPGPGQSRVFKG